MSHDDHSLPQDVPQLQAMLLAERANIAVLSGQHETAIAQHLSSLAEYKEGSIQSDKVIETQHVTIDQLTRKVEGLQQQLARYLRKLYGPQRERIDPNQLTLFSAEELQQLVSELQQGVVDSVSTDDGSEADDTSPDAVATGAASPPTPPKPKGHGRRPLPEHIPRETVIHELSDAERL